jgi:hypothetical protein
MALSSPCTEFRCKFGKEVSIGGLEFDHICKIY